MKERLAEVYERLQALDINPTRKNLTILLDALNGIREVYEAMELERGEKDVRAEAE